MKKPQKIADAAETALSSLGKPSKVENIYDEILRLNLYRFRTPTPLLVLETELKRHSEGSPRSDKRSVSRFKILKNRTYGLINDQVSDALIENKYKSALDRIHQERGDFLLPQIFDYVNKKKWIDPRPDYQRRLVWNNDEKSLFLESLLMNLPVPPLVLYELSYGSWEIMDGQQRTSAVVEFYSGKLKLSGLERWRELNGRTYSDCPPIVRKGFDRRRLQVTTILTESEDRADFDMRKEVFERLNTGGKPLRAQEIRNCLYAGEFCDLLEELSSGSAFTSMWRIPAHQPSKYLGDFPRELIDNKLFARMDDCEIVLRFFAFESMDFWSGSVKKTLDNCMKVYCKADSSILESLNAKYSQRISLVFDVFGVDAFTVNNRPAKKLYDALMAAIGAFADRREELIKRRAIIRKRLNILLSDESSIQIIIDQHDSKDGFLERVKLIQNLIKGQL